MSTREFSHFVRVLLCVSCGAPLEIDLTTTSRVCGSCSAVNVFGARDDRPMVEGRAPSSPVDESQRLQHLRMQVGKPLLPPPTLVALVPGGRIEPWKVEEVFAVWQSTREETRTTRSYDAAERLVYLTLVLTNHHSRDHDLLRQRAMFESALELLTLLRHRQMMRGFLSRAATRAGDLEAADAWLLPCDTRSDDLQTDTACRVSRAYLDTRRTAWANVHALLGEGEQEVPVANVMVPLATLLRANAWEQRGQPDRAEALLREAMGRGPADRSAFDSILAVHAEWGLCRQTFRRAEAAYESHGAKSAGGLPRVVGGLFFWLGMILLLVSVVCLALTALLGLAAVVASRTGMGANIADTYGTLAFVFAMFLPGLLTAGLVLWLVGRGFRKEAKKEQRLRLRGIRGTARVTGMRAMGEELNSVPRMELGLRVELPDRDPYEAKARMWLPTHLQAHFGQGVTVHVRVDPEDPEEVMIEMD